MVERDRTDTDDIEFEFFDEPQTTEEPPAEPPPPKRRRRVRTRPPSGGAPLLRLVLLVAAAIFLAVVLVLWVNSCREGQTRDAYQDYMGAVSGVANESQDIGQRLNEVLTEPGITLTDLRTKLDGLREEQAQTTLRTQGLSPPEALDEEQQSLVEAMQFRVSGLQGLTDAFGQLAQSSDPVNEADDAGVALAAQAIRLVASDVVYEDLFKARAQAVLQEQEISGVAVPDSKFLEDPNFASTSSIKPLLKRLTGGDTGDGGLHGNMVAEVRAQPGDQILSATDENTIILSDQLTFQVLVRNSGDNQETQVPVSLTIQQGDKPIVKRKKIDSINPDETVTVTFKGFGNLDLVTQTTLDVVVEPVKDEKNTANNSAQYRVFFTLS